MVSVGYTPDSKKKLRMNNSQTADNRRRLTLQGTVFVLAFVSVWNCSVAIVRILVRQSMVIASFVSEIFVELYLPVVVVYIFVSSRSLNDLISVHNLAITTRAITSRRARPSDTNIHATGSISLSEEGENTSRSVKAASLFITSHGLFEILGKDVVKSPAALVNV